MIYIYMLLLFRTMRHLSSLKGLKEVARCGEQSLLSTTSPVFAVRSVHTGLWTRHEVTPDASWLSP